MRCKSRVVVAQFGINDASIFVKLNHYLTGNRFDRIIGHRL